MPHFTDVQTEEKNGNVACQSGWNMGGAPRVWAGLW